MSATSAVTSEIRPSRRAVDSRDVMVSSVAGERFGGNLVRRERVVTVVDETDPGAAVLTWAQEESRDVNSIVGNRHRGRPVVRGRRSGGPGSTARDASI